MKFLWYVKALYVMHDTEKTEMDLNRTHSSPKQYDTHSKIERMLFHVCWFKYRQCRQPQAEWPPFRVHCSPLRECTGSQTQCDCSFMSSVLPAGSEQTVRYR